MVRLNLQQCYSIFVYSMIDVFIHELAVVDDGAKIGKGTRIWHFAHIRDSALVGEGCNIGKGVYIDTKVVIGNNVKIQNGVSVYHGVTIEDDVFCGPHMTFTNDLYPRSFTNTWKVTETLVKRGASVGAHAVIICGITLGEYCMVGSGSVVTKSVPPFGLVRGNPARLVGFVCKCGHPLHEEVEHTADYVKFQCSECEERITIPISDYKKKIR
jgi:UDP-2-acetamido-3-amino-2,3-dideoxy-glucuronate N-acetyltransferase